MTSPRARWLAARTRNAARHGLIIAGVGTIVMIATLLTFVLLPRQADRALSNAISALPAPTDTLKLAARRARADSLRRQAEAQRAAALVAAAATLPAANALAGAPADSQVTVAMPAPTAPAPTAPPPTVTPARSGADSARQELVRLLARSRQAPLAESQRALAAALSAMLTRTTPTSREGALTTSRRAALSAMVSRLRDSVETVDRERELSAALSGPDARYAALTARLTALGARLAAIADEVLRADGSAATPGDTATDNRLTSERQSLAPGQAAQPGAVLDAGPRPLARTLLPDSLLDAAVRAASDSVVLLDSLMARARRDNAAIEQAKSALRARMQVHIPPVAMLFASLVLGLALGFAVSLWREMRRPTVGDALELEAITGSRVIVHHTDDAARLSLLAARLGRRARKGEAQAPALTPSADAWPLLHLTLSNIGDTAPHVQILADRPVVAGAVGLNLASVAARESRATVLVDAAQRAGAVVPLLPSPVLVARGRADSRHPWDDNWDASRSLPLGRDASVDLVLPRRARRHNPLAPEPTAPDVLAPLLRQYDFVVFVTDMAHVPMVPHTADIVLGARLGVTPLAWVARAVRSADEQGRRIRAVVLWAEDVPLAGSRASG